jgi:hypothetical protein
MLTTRTDPASPARRRRRRAAVVALLLALPLVLAAPASAMLEVGIRAGHVASGGQLDVWAGGDGAARRLAIVIAPADRVPPFQHSCYCQTTTWPVPAPLRVIGWISFDRDRYSHWTRVRLPRLAPGRYKVFAIWRAPRPRPDPARPGAVLLFAASRYLEGGRVDGSLLRGLPLTVTA